MKLNPLQVAALLAAAALSSPALAQSTVTIGGRLDLAAAKPVGSANKQLADGFGSRLVFRGSEDLGGGLRAVFLLDHRFAPDTGTANATFWNGESVVGLQGGFGRVLLGRTYTSAWQLTQNTIDPFGGDTIAALRGVGLQIAPARMRLPDQVRYDFFGKGFNVAADIAEADLALGPDRPYSVAANFTVGALFVTVAHENPGGARDKLSTVGVRFAVGPVVLRAGTSRGTNNAGAKVEGILVGASAAVGPGQLLAGFATNETAGRSNVRKAAFGYRYPLSTRTTLYADVARDSKAARDKTGYDLGIQHNF